jgi:PqqA peptide cyclase
MQPRAAEMDTEVWTRVFREAAELGVLHVHLTGGEPVLRRIWKNWSARAAPRTCT